MAMEFRNPRYANAEGSAIDMEINHPDYGWIPFTASRDDQEEHGRELFDLAVAGGAVEAYVPPTPEEQRAAMPSLSAAKYRQGLLSVGHNPQEVTDAIAALPNGPEKDSIAIEWEYATSFERLQQFVIEVGELLGMTPEETDQMWMAAASLGSRRRLH